MIKACILTLGCRVNQYESDFIMEELSKKGVIITSFEDIADIYIINTCSVTGESDRKSRQFIRKCIKKNPDATVIVTGCFSQINKDAAESIEGVDLVIGNNEKSRIADIALSLYEGKNVSPCGFDIYNGKYDVMQVGAPLKRTRAFVKIEDGCDSKCAYCIIPYARGRVRSRKEEEVLTEVKNLAANGYKEVVLTGIHLSSYGMTGGTDFSKSKLLSLIQAVSEIEGIERIRLGSLEPRIITEEFAKGLADTTPEYWKWKHFSENGQLWGNPIYNWKKQKKDGYSWWIKRLSSCREKYDVLRIDHFRAFADYYCIPFGSETAKTGEWKDGPGMDLFSRVFEELEGYPIIAEDLGDLSPAVVELLKESGLPGMKVIQFCFDMYGDSTILLDDYSIAIEAPTVRK